MSRYGRYEEDPTCFTCGEGVGQRDECPGSKRECGHHCNHIWDQDACCWCTAHINEFGDLVQPDGTVVPS